MIIRARIDIKNSGATFIPEGLPQYEAKKVFDNCKHISLSFIIDSVCGTVVILHATLTTFDKYSSHFVGYDMNKKHH